MNARDTAIVLAALRMAQGNIQTLNSMPQMDDAGGEVSNDEIDDLCERINFDLWKGNHQ